MTNVLYINASPRGEASAAAQAAQIFLDALPPTANVTTLNLFEAALPDYTPALAGGTDARALLRQVPRAVRVNLTNRYAAARALGDRIRKYRGAKVDPVKVLLREPDHFLPAHELVARRPEHFILAVEPPDFPQRLAAASLGVFGLGGLTDEALTLGLPSLNLGLTRFHELRGQALEAEGVITYLGRFGTVPPGAIVDAVLGLRRDPDRLGAQRRRALALYDGRGSERVAQAILGFL